MNASEPLLRQDLENTTLRYSSHFSRVTPNLVIPTKTIMSILPFENDIDFLLSHDLNASCFMLTRIFFNAMQTPKRLSLQISNFFYDCNNDTIDSFMRALAAALYFILSTIFILEFCTITTFRIPLMYYETVNYLFLRLYQQHERRGDLQNPRATTRRRTGKRG